MEVARLAILAGICVVAYLVGEGLAKLHVPRLPAYLAVGALAGQLIKSSVESANTAFPVVNVVALCVIGFVAGSHLVWSVVKPRIKPIAFQVVGISTAVFAVVAFVVYIVLPGEIPAPARLAAAILAGTVMLALSPPEAIAIISESKAVGPFTGLVLGATVVMDVVVVSLFSVALTVAKSLTGAESSFSELVSTVGLGILLAVIGGLVIGLLLKLVVDRVGSNVALGILVFVLSALAAVIAEMSVRWGLNVHGLELEIEPLLIAMIAGLFVANTAKNSVRFADMLERLAPWVYVVFFTLTGLGLHIETLIAAAVPALILWALRVAGLWTGSTAAMTLAKEPPIVRKVTWRAFVPQAGIALALAATISAEFPESGPVFASVIIGTIVLNEATGPFFLRSALVAAGEVVSEKERLD